MTSRKTLEEAKIINAMLKEKTVFNLDAKTESIIIEKFVLF